MARGYGGFNCGGAGGGFLWIIIIIIFKTATTPLLQGLLGVKCF